MAVLLARGLLGQLRPCIPRQVWACCRLRQARPDSSPKPAQLPSLRLRFLPSLHLHLNLAATLRHPYHAHAAPAPLSLARTQWSSTIPLSPHHPPSSPVSTPRQSEARATAKCRQATRAPAVPTRRGGRQLRAILRLCLPLHMRRTREVERRASDRSISPAISHRHRSGQLLIRCVLTLDQPRSHRQQTPLPIALAQLDLMLVHPSPFLSRRARHNQHRMGRLALRRADHPQPTQPARPVVRLSSAPTRRLQQPAALTRLTMRRQVSRRRRPPRPSARDL